MKLFVFIVLCAISVVAVSAPDPGWGFTYDDLQTKIAEWQKSDNVVVDTIGYSVENRALIRVTIQTKTPKEIKYRVVIHARTHPLEVQSSHVTNQIIDQLLSNTELSRQLLDSCVFNIVPMYNPDGVSHGEYFERYNANGVDIESNWSAQNPEKEVVALRKSFEGYMNSSLPVSVALNMHSAYDCQRYFVVHDAFGTTPSYFESEKRFVSAVRSYWSDGFQVWNRFVTWKTSTPTQYPESWFWNNHKDKVLALTYEDMNCPEAGEYGKTANAILGGMRDYLFKRLIVIDAPVGVPDIPISNEILNVYPNPAQQGGSVVVNCNDKSVDWKLIRVTASNGQAVFEDIVHGFPQNIPLDNLGQGIYNIQLYSDERIISANMLIK